MKKRLGKDIQDAILVEMKHYLREGRMNGWFGISHTLLDRDVIVRYSIEELEKPNT